MKKSQSTNTLWEKLMPIRASELFNDEEMKRVKWILKLFQGKVVRVYEQKTEAESLESYVQVHKAKTLRQKRLRQMRNLRR